MKVFKTLGTIIGLYIVSRVFIPILTPNGGEGFATLADIILIGSLLLTVLSLLLGRSSKALKSVLRTLSLIIGLAAVIIVISFMTGHQGGDVITTMINEIIPFGKIIGSVLGVLQASAMYEAPLFSPLNFLTDSAKLLLQAILNPIITGIVFVFVFNNEREVWESKKTYAERSYSQFINPEPAYDRRARSFSFSGAIAGFFGAIYAAYAAAFVFSGLISILSDTMGVSETLINALFIIVIIGLLLLAWLSPILRTDKRPHTGLSISQGQNVLTKLLFNLIKMIVLNIVIVFIISLFSGTVS